MQNQTERNNRSKFIHRVNLFLKYNSIALENYTALEVIQNISVKIEDLDHQCRFYPVNIRNKNKSDPFYTSFISCQTIQSVLPIVYDGKKCFTYFSDLVDVKKDWKFVPPDNFIIDFDPNCNEDNCPHYNITKVTDYKKIITKKFTF